MTNPQNNSNLAPWKWALIGAGSTLVLALAGFGLYNLLNPKTSSTSTSTSTSVANATPDNNVAKQLIGQWQEQISGEYSLKLIFTPEGKLFILSSPTLASEMEYQTNVNSQPKHLDLLAGGQIFANTIFDLTADGQLRLQLDNLDSQPRPTSFSDNAKLFQKISEQTTLPANVRVFNVQNQQKLARQSEAKQYVSSMSKGQQAVYAEKGRFASTQEELGVGIKSETENYSYSIVLSKDNRWVQAIGLAKIDGLKNYTGIVSLVKGPNDESTSTQSRLCESTQPSKELPGTPTATNSPDLQCPSGYSDVLR